MQTIDHTPETTKIGPHHIYTVDSPQRELRQSEIISDIIQFIYDSESGEVTSITHPYVIILNQDCDLLWDYESRCKGVEGDLSSILAYEIEVSTEVKQKLPGSDVWKRVLQNREERYHFLEAIPPDCDAASAGISDLIIDFKRFFTMPPAELYRQLKNQNGAKRRCRLQMPYREHLQFRAATYLQRVGLPEPHKPTPVAKVLPPPIQPPQSG